MDLDDFVMRAKDMSDEELEEALLQVRANRRLRPEKRVSSPKEPKAATPKPHILLSDEDADLLGDL